MFKNTTSEQIRQVTLILRHPKWNQISKANDIAVLLIDSPFKLNDNVQPIALPLEQGQETTGNIVVSGWGYNSQWSDRFPDILQFVQLPVVDDATCQQIYESRQTILESMICTGNIEVGGKGICSYDSGGPVRSIEGNYLTGIVSYYTVSCYDLYLIYMLKLSILIVLSIINA